MRRIRRASASDLKSDDSDGLWTPLIGNSDHQKAPSKGVPLWKDPTPPTSNPRKQTTTSTRRPSVLSVGMNRVRGISKTMKSMAERDLKFEAHGIPMALNASAWYARGIWLLLSVCSLSVFLYQCWWVLERYKRRDKIVSVQLQFEVAPFPAVTICNQNPFKHNSVRTIPQIAETLDAFHQAYEPVQSDCECKRSKRTGKVECTQKDSVPASNDSVCICNFDRQDRTSWPCFPANTWTEEVCPECNDIGYCNLPRTSGSDQIPCLCQIRGKEIPKEDSPFRADFLEQLKSLGFGNMTDEVAITTKTKEKIVLLLAGLPLGQRIALSYGKSEFIRMCSMNGAVEDVIPSCDWLHVDPSFGNCYTFNANADKNLTSSRAGPSYGLRLLVNINGSDYLPTTQARGVRLAIHDKLHVPFPDTFDKQTRKKQSTTSILPLSYSAPTASVSSFGMSMRRVTRLSEPYGDCVKSSEPIPPSFIYRTSRYEPEACYRSCYQSWIILRCGCADPRYPTANNYTKLCDSLEVFARTCLMRESTRFTRSSICKCRHACEHSVWTTTYSSARLTSEAFGSNCESRARSCVEKFDPESSVMLEVYYEQMSYEALSEREAYSFVNFLSDVGGQAGLWLGASVITLFEALLRPPIAKIGLPGAFDSCAKERQLQATQAALRRRPSRNEKNAPLDFRCDNYFTICLLLTLMFAVAIVATVALFVVSGKCPGGVQPAPVVYSYEKAMISYATAQEAKAAKRLAAEAEESGDEEERAAHRLVRAINEANSTWTARFNPSAVGMEVQKQISDKMNENGKVPTDVYLALSDMLNLVRLNGPFHSKYVRHLELLYETIMDGIPPRFDARVKWPACDIGRVSDQGGCGSCWSVAATSIMSDRYCIQSGGTKFRFSAQKLIECCAFCGRDPLSPCFPFYFYYESGLVSETCAPYTIATNCGSPCKLETYFNPVGLKNCSKLCANGRSERRKHASYMYRIGTANGTSFSVINSLSRTYDFLRKTNGWREVDDLTLAKADLMRNGPFTTCFHVHEGFLHYFEGEIYTHLKDIDTLHLYDHCVKIVGWDEKSLFAINSWSTNWAKDGTFRLDIQMLKDARGDLHAAMPDLTY
ncbi:Na+ channel, amiloride-sensitive family and Degenerin family-containing protein [Aphelenchoides fujianensis]|nr:Na+ channel, amiloride-sensitive family and Degenerin family-containing protein [Aphelenchoides fujianensis]